MELNQFEKNKTWELVNFPTGKNNIAVEWIYKTKLNEKCQIEKHKARLVAKGYAQRRKTDYGETFAPVARLDIVRLVLAIAAENKWLIYNLDVKYAFLMVPYKKRYMLNTTLVLKLEDKKIKSTD